jgi:Uma2 family endonuclease
VLRGATYEDLLKVPANLVAELIYDELYTSPRPSSRHARANSILERRLGRAFDDGEDGPGGWWIVTEPELHLGRNVIVPDLAGWRREHMPDYPDTSGCEVPPDWACEIHSPKHRTH